jgi:hypothetical protein
MTRKSSKNPAITTTIREAITAFADNALAGADQPPMLAIGPVLWGTERGKDGRHWYFVVCGLGADREIRIDQFKIGQDDHDLAEHCRTALCLELVQRRPIVLNDFDDELALVRWCEAVAPSERTTRLRAAVEGERRETAT